MQFPWCNLLYIQTILDYADLLKYFSDSDIPSQANQGIGLGAFLGVNYLRGRKKLTFFISKQINPLKFWLEQLVAESTGKQGKGFFSLYNKA